MLQKKNTLTRLVAVFMICMFGLVGGTALKAAFTPGTAHAVPPPCENGHCVDVSLQEVCAFSFGSTCGFTPQGECLSYTHCG